MRYARFAVNGAAYDGVVEGNDVRSGALVRALSDVTLLTPCLPTKIVCVGKNYRDHAAEMGGQPPPQPLLFFKPPSAALEPGGVIRYPPQSNRVDFEGELAIVIGQRCRSVARSAARSVIMGFTAFNDVTARDIQQVESQWARAKGFDTFAPFGPWIVDSVDPAALRVRTSLNGEVRQDAATSTMIFDVDYLIEYVSAAFTLEPGDIIATGTPAGIGSMQPGDEVTVEIEGIGALRNRVAQA